MWIIVEHNSQTAPLTQPATILWPPQSGLGNEVVFDLLKEQLWRFYPSPQGPLHPLSSTLQRITIVNYLCLYTSVLY